MTSQPRKGPLRLRVNEKRIKRKKRQALKQEGGGAQGTGLGGWSDSDSQLQADKQLTRLFIHRTEVVNAHEKEREGTSGKGRLNKTIVGEDILMKAWSERGQDAQVERSREGHR